MQAAGVSLPEHRLPAYQGELEDQLRQHQGLSAEILLPWQLKPDYDRCTVATLAAHACRSRQGKGNARNQALTSDMRCFPSPWSTNWCASKRRPSSSSAAWTAPRLGRTVVSSPEIAGRLGKYPGPRPRRRAGHSEGNAG